jgi:hypothetical protein
MILNLVARPALPRSNLKQCALRYLAIDYVVSEKKNDLQHERKTLRYLAIIKALVDYITVR